MPYDSPNAWTPIKITKHSINAVNVGCGQKRRRLRFTQQDVDEFFRRQEG